MMNPVCVMLDTCAIFRAYFEVRSHTPVMTKSYLTILRNNLGIDLMGGSAAASLPVNYL